MFLPLCSLFIFHEDTQGQKHTPTHTCTPLVIRIYYSCWESEWSVCLCVCVLFSSMSLAQAVGHSNFAGVNSDLWLHYSWLDWFSPRGWPAARYYTLQWHSQGHTLPSVPSIYPVSPSSYPSIHPCIHLPHLSYRSSFWLPFIRLCLSPFSSQATLSFIHTNHPGCLPHFLFSSLYDTSLLFIHPSLSLTLSPFLLLSCEASVPASHSPTFFFFNHTGQRHVDIRTSHPYVIFEHLILKNMGMNVPPVKVFRNILAPGCRDLLPLSRKSISEVQHWCWAIRPGSQEPFRFIPKGVRWGWDQGSVQASEREAITRVGRAAGPLI